MPPLQDAHHSRRVLRVRNLRAKLPGGQLQPPGDHVIPPRLPEVGDAVRFTERYPQIWGVEWTGRVEHVEPDGRALIRHYTGMGVGAAPYDPEGKPGTWRFTPSL